MPIADDTSNCSKCGSPMGMSPDGKEPICRSCVMMNLMGGAEETTQEVESTDPDAYEIHESIGRGGAGTIYRATEKKMGRVVALKLLNTAHTEIVAAKERFLTEVRAVAALDHPNIIPIYATGELDGRLFFAMRYYRRGSLDVHLDQFQGQPERSAALVAKVARALHHAHERGVLHRDIKPSNILLDKEGEPSITDFGLAKLEGNDSELTVTGAVMGTPKHMSPEQVQGDAAAVTTASDLFSLGTVLYQLLTGRPPFSGESEHSVMRSVVETEVGFTKSEFSEVDRDLRTICLKCLEKDPARRYSSALALAEDIDRWESGEPIKARQITGGERLRRWVRRHPWQVIALTALVVGSIASFALWRQAEAARVVADHNADIAEEHASVAEENADYAMVANALAARERFDYGQAHRLLERIPPGRRGFEWGLVNGLSRSEFQWSVDFGGARPVDVSYDSGRDRIAVITDDRKLHLIDPGSRSIVGTADLPNRNDYRSHEMWDQQFEQLVFSPQYTPTERVSDFFNQHWGPRFIAFSPDGGHHVYLDGALVVVVETATGDIVHLGWSFGASPLWLDSGTLLFGSEADPVAGHRVETTLLELGSGKTSHLPPNMTAPLACTPEGELIALVQDDTTVLVFNRSEQFYEEVPLRVFERDEGTVTAIQMSSDGAHLAVVWTDLGGAELSVFEIASGNVVFAQSLIASPAIAFWPDSSELAIAGRETWFSSWEIGVQTDTPASGIGRRLPPGIRMPATERILNAGTLPKLHLGHRAPVRAILPYTDDGSAMITVSGDGRMCVWRQANPESDSRRKDRVVTSLAELHPLASPNGEHVLYMHESEEGADHLRVWHRRAGLESVLPADHNQVAAFDDGRVVTFHYPYTVDGVGGGLRDYFCWQTKPGQPPVELWRIKDCTLPWGYKITQSARSPEGRIAVVFPPAVIVLDLNRLGEPDANGDYKVEPVHREKFYPLQSRAVPGRTISISTNGKYAAMTGLSNNVFVKDLDLSFSPANLKHLVPEGPAISTNGNGQHSDPLHRNPIRDSACAFAADNSRLFVGNENGWVHVFDVENEFKLLPEEGWQAHSDTITALAVSQSGEMIATAGGDSIILWSTEKKDGRPRRNRLHLNTGEHPRNWVQFCGTDTVLFHSSAAGVIEAWETQK